MINNQHRLATLLVGGLAVVTLAACGPSASSAGSNPSAPSGNASGQPGRGFPGVSGLIVALSGKTMQVRTISGQSAVTYTGKTTVTEQQSTKASAARVGMCATVRSTDQSSAGASQGSSITARTVSLSDQVDGSCQVGFGGFGGRGNRPGGLPSGGPGGELPSGMPSGAIPSGAPRGGFGGASGKITAVSGSTLTIEQTRGTEKSTVAVNLTGDTTYTEQVKTGTSAIATNRCVLATGKSDSTGALAATAIRLSAPVNGECGFGGGRRASGSQSGG
ncbi:hypothetical protein [Microlunatus ginsengisoli]|uniref:DUF5666 domain-containing protein n=1 Tax=Microlunatus ginsengisoli TaxID=363863 RepID=A0ABP6ZU88_9ACTN